MTEPCSMLFVPADTERFLAKAGQRGADALILDLEDAVARQSKVAARENLATFVPLLKASAGVPIISSVAAIAAARRILVNVAMGLQAK